MPDARWLLDQAEALAVSEPLPSLKYVRLDELRALLGSVGSDPALDRLRALFDASGPKPAQRQDSLAAQLRSVYALAVSHGCYDAADFVKNAIEH